MDNLNKFKVKNDIGNLYSCGVCPSFSKISPYLIALSPF